MPAQSRQSFEKLKSDNPIRMIMKSAMQKIGERMREEVLELFNEKKTLSLKELAALLHIEKNKELKELGIVLKELEDERQIYNDHSQYHLIDNDQWMAGSLRDVSAADYAVANKDKRVFIPKNGNVFMDRDEVLVKLRGGDLMILWDRERNTVFMTGPAAVICSGKIALPWEEQDIRN